MKDIPFFTTEYGVASLTLSQIPYSETAYIQAQTVQEGKLDDLIAACVGFCRAAGAEKIFWTAEEVLHTPHSQIIEMRGQSRPDPNMVENLFPVTEQTASRWRQIHNEKMGCVDHAAYLSAADEKMLINGNAYFIHRQGRLLGIGWLEEDTVRAVASVEKGAGERIMHTLMSLVPDRLLRLEVASTNKKAVELYQRLGFVPVNILKNWFAVQ